MVIDNLKNAPYYYGCHPKIDLILRYLKSDRKGLVQAHTGPQALPPELTEAGISMKIVEFDTVEGTRRWESHPVHSFVYYMLEGSERTGYGDISQTGDGVKTEGKDQILYPNGDGDRIRFPQGHFFILFPQDANMSKLADGVPAKAKKCSFKFQR